MKIKESGDSMIGQVAELVAHKAAANEMPPYELLLADAMNGDATSFERRFGGGSVAN